MIYVFDLDFTLFDTGKFLTCLPKAMGVAPCVFSATREKYFPEILFSRQYSGYEHINYLKKDGYIKDSARARKNIAALFKTIDQYVYPGADELLKRLKKPENRLVLLTFGNIRWQKAKTANIRIRKYFNKIIWTDKRKDLALAFLKKQKEPAFIINDNARENLAIKKKLGGRARVILVKSSHSRNAKHNMKEYSFNQILRIL